MHAGRALDGARAAQRIQRQQWRGLAAEQVRRELGRSLLKTFRREYNAVPAALGYRYEGSPIIVPDNSQPVPDPMDQYFRSARPGHRAPHVWVAPGVSTLDLFGPGFTVLVIGRDAESAQPLCAAAASVRLPLKLHTFRDGSVMDAMLEAYESPYVLVRPDGHVAARLDSIPARPEEIIEVVRGAAVRGDE